MEHILTETEARKDVEEKEFDPEEIALILQGRVDDCCIS